jgi:hypothetical protein
MADQWTVEVIFRGGMTSQIICRNREEAHERVKNLRTSISVESAKIYSKSPHPIVTQPETNLPISGLGGYDQVLRDEFEDGKK